MGCDSGGYDDNPFYRIELEQWCLLVLWLDVSWLGLGWRMGLFVAGCGSGGSGGGELMAPSFHGLSVVDVPKKEHS